MGHLSNSPATGLARARLSVVGPPPGKFNGQCRTQNYRFRIQWSMLMQEFRLDLYSKAYPGY
eukprot:2692-Hanusia_phi.AAC.1